MKAGEIKELAISFGAEKCGIAIIDRFREAPAGFNPKDIYPLTQSVVVFLIQMPTEIIKVTNPIPYTSTAYMLYSELDHIGLKLCKALEKQGHKDLANIIRRI